ncbi:MAG: transporter, partial [Alphaproteobacteria bacterium]|nr:transporter [Alphaproteobacteria bacterium]
NSVYFLSGDAGTAVLQGKVNAGLDLTMVLNIVSAGYTFEQEVLGATYTVGAAIPFGYAELEATITTAGGGSISAQRDSINIADIALVPLELTWTIDNFSIQLGEAIYAPTGAYDVDEVVNIGLNRWGFDTALAVTYLNPKTGTEVSIAPGVIYNTENDDTDYQTGIEFHLDFTANQFLSETFAIGVRGYYYNQITGDSGSGKIRRRKTRGARKVDPRLRRNQPLRVRLCDFDGGLDFLNLVSGQNLMFSRLHITHFIYVTKLRRLPVQSIRILRAIGVVELSSCFF